MEGLLVLLSDFFAILGLCALMCEVWQLGYMQVTKARAGSVSANDNEIALGGALFIAFCVTLFVLFGVLAIAAGAEAPG